ncbi:MAG: transglutaminase family protein [Rubrivivax sp.]|nr:transglutaminase family protein [Rubrivivax sp.]
MGDTDTSANGSPGSPAGAPPPGAVVLEVRHDTVYTYETPVSVAQHLAHLQPLADEHQQLLAWTLDVDPPPAFRRDSRDALGNAQTHFSLAQPHRTLRVCATSLVRVAARFTALDAAASPPWEVLAAGLRYVAGARFEPAVEFVPSSPFVPSLPELRTWALGSFAAGTPVAVGALHLMRRLHEEFRYDSRSTEVDTPLAEVFAHRHGVCQDFAHLMIGGLRMLGLPARYVSGYLLTQQPGSGVPLVGADASHAWVQVWCPRTPGVPGGWLSLDPTNDVVPETGHVRVAIGRDFGDVTPLRGVIRGGGRHELAVAVATRVVEPPAPAVARSLHSA